jgi:inosine/xanthosine triphosphate pyrophosphatase family protein
LQSEARARGEEAAAEAQRTGAERAVRERVAALRARGVPLLEEDSSLRAKEVRES